MRAQFIRFAVNNGILRFGEFRTKAGRLSPYFFNAGLFNDGASLGRLAQFYAQTLLAAERAGRVRFDMLFVPAYKGITLASATAVALAHDGRNVAFAFNRKEAKDHGEGGLLVGAPLAGRVLIVDDVITAGTAVRESLALIRAAGAEPAGVLIALDRQERGQGERSAAQEVAADYGIPVLAIARLADILAYAALRPELTAQRPRLVSYRERYGVADEA
ncbi:MAG: orotate phosphoribosyltransferase [Xanthomonadaceae bacterium]|nr:orotate phosphoribosyltransferase [Xanthomonadaceae bacterium]